MDTVSVQKYFISGADPGNITEPDRLWGNGKLNIYDVFESLRGY